MCSACQEEQVIPPIPRRQNSRPYFLEENPTPVERTFSMGRKDSSRVPPCPAPTFSINVGDRDFDLGDKIRQQWFIDATPTHVGGIVYQNAALNPSPTQDHYPLPATPPPAFYNDPLFTSLPPGEHLIEVVIADGELVPQESPGVPPHLTAISREYPGEAADGGVLIDASYMVTYAWTVIGTSGCPQMETP